MSDSHPLRNQMRTGQEPPVGSLDARTVLTQRWGWIVAIGVLLSVCGLVALGSVLLTTVVSVIVVGVMMAVAGVAEVIHGVALKSWGRAFLWVIIGSLYVLAGAFAVANPLLAAGVLTLLLGASLVASGLVRIILAVQMTSGTPWVWVALSGLITALLGGMILARWPESSLYVLGLFLGLDLLFAGASWIGIGLALRRARD